MRNPIYEQALEKNGVKWRYEEKVKLDDIDAGKSLQNQARLDQPLDEELVEAYARGYKDGDQFPPLVLWRAGRGRWVLIDGNQRRAALDSVRRKTTDAYVVESDDKQVVDRLTWTWNNQVNGKRLSQDEALEHAVTFVRKYAYTIETAAKEWGVKIWKVRDRARAMDLRDVLAKHSVPQTDRLEDRKLNNLYGLNGVDENLFVKAATLTIKSGLTLDDTEELAKAVSKARTYEGKTEALDTFAESEVVRTRRAETKGGTIQRRTPLPREQLARLLAQVQRLLEGYDKVALRQGTKEDQKRVREAAFDVVCHLTALYGLGALPAKEASA